MRRTGDVASIRLCTYPRTLSVQPELTEDPATERANKDVRGHGNVLKIYNSLENINIIESS